jgi:hypothetical protein
MFVLDVEIHIMAIAWSICNNGNNIIFDDGEHFFHKIDSANVYIEFITDDIHGNFVGLDIASSVERGIFGGWNREEAFDFMHFVFRLCRWIPNEERAGPVICP